MTYLISGIVFLLIFSLLILIHEWGHFTAARKAGVKVEEFGMGLPPRAKGLFTDKKGTLYSLNWIPFGGFVRMYGEDSEDEEMWKKEGSFSSKSIAWRTLIILGGVIMNFLLGYVILVYLFSVGTQPFLVTAEDFQYYRDAGYIDAIDQVVISDFADGSFAPDAGLQAGDIFVTIDGQTAAQNQDVISLAQSSPDETLDVVVRRGEGEEAFQLPLMDEKRLGVVIVEQPEVLEVRELQYSFGKALTVAGYETARLSVLTMKMFVGVLVDLVTSFSVPEQISGPVGIAQITHKTTQNGNFDDLLKLIALLSISLGAINVLPIPALDGGRFLSIIFEVVTRKRPNAAWEARIHAFGFLLLIALILLVTYQDILRVFAG